MDADKHQLTEVVVCNRPAALEYHFFYGDHFSSYFRQTDLILVFIGAFGQFIISDEVSYGAVTFLIKYCVPPPSIILRPTSL